MQQDPIPEQMDIDAIHKALANPVRREILAWLKEPQVHFPEQSLPLVNGVCAGQIDKRCEMSQSTVSAHLATLHKAGLISSTRIGQWVFFKRDEAAIQAFVEHIKGL
jgi:ArsR family transcriptional regulator